MSTIWSLVTGLWLLATGTRWKYSNVITGFRFQVSAQSLAAGAASLIEDETSLDPEKSLKILWDPGDGKLTRFYQSHDRGWPATSSVESKPLPPATNLSLKMALIFMKFHMNAAGFGFSSSFGSSSYSYSFSSSTPLYLFRFRGRGRRRGRVELLA
jgi:hypothetical protein